MNRSFAEEKEEQKKREKEASTDLERRIAAQTKELAALNTIAAAVSSSLDLNNVLNRALDKTLEVMEIDAGGIYLLDEGTGILDIVAHRGFAPDFVEVGFEMACAQLDECCKIEPNNQQVRNLREKCRSIRARYLSSYRQLVCQPA